MVRHMRGKVIIDFTARCSGRLGKTDEFGDLRANKQRSSWSMKHQNELHVLSLVGLVDFPARVGKGCLVSYGEKGGAGDNCLPVFLTHQQRIPRARNISWLADSRIRVWHFRSRREGKKERATKSTRKDREQKLGFQSRQGGVCIW